MAAAVLVRGGSVLFRVDLAPRHYTAFSLGDDAELGAAAAAQRYPDGLPTELVRALRGADGPIACSDPDLRDALGRAGLAARLPTLEEERAALSALPGPRPAEEHAFLIRLAYERVQLTLQSDEEALIALAREEERVERSANRELGAAEQFLAAGTGPLAEYAVEWSAHRTVLAEHHDRLLGRLEEIAERTVPNLAHLVGARVAARLVAITGGRAALARMSASRLQILGSRRRPGVGRGPRFGLLYRAARMSDVPRNRQGRYARSLAALAAIAARADGLTHRDLGDLLVARRDRRVERLRRRT